MKKVYFLLPVLMGSLHLAAQPVITTSPTNQTVLANSTNTVFTVGVSGTGPFSYQWSCNGTNLPNNIITTIAGKGSSGFSGDGGAATNAYLRNPTALAIDSLGNIFIADSMNNRIRKVNTNGIITTIAGTNVTGYSGDGGVATNAKISAPYGITVNKEGAVYFVDAANARIRKVNTNGIINTIAGNGTNGFSGDGGQATNAQIKVLDVSGMCFDSLGNLFFVDGGNGRVRKIDTNGIITTTISGLNTARGMTIDSSGNFFVTEGTRIRKFDTNNVATTVAGGGASLVDGGLATNAQIVPFCVCVDTIGNLFFGDNNSGRRGVRMVDTNGIMTAAAGGHSDLVGSTGDGYTATNATLGCPYAVVFDPYGNLLILDEFYSVVRKVWVAGLPTFPFGRLSPNFSGNYQVVVTDSNGSTTSTLASLSIQYPAITEMFVNTNFRRFQLGWPAFQPSVFQVQWTTNLASGVWSNLGSTVPYNATTNGTARRLDAGWSNYVYGFYRILWVQ